MKHLSINPKATLLLNDTIFSLQVRLVESFFVSKYFRQRFLHETPTQLTAHPKNVTFSKTKHEFPHDNNDNDKEPSLLSYSRVSTSWLSFSLSQALR